MLKTEDFQVKLENSHQLDYTNPSSAVDHITNILIDAADKAKIKSVTKRGHGDPPWFDKACKKLKGDIKLLGNKIKCDPKNQVYKTQLSNLKNPLKKLVKGNTFGYKSKLMEQMKHSKTDSKYFWKALEKWNKNKMMPFSNKVSQNKDGHRILKLYSKDQMETFHYRKIRQRGVTLIMKSRKRK